MWSYLEPEERDDKHLRQACMLAEDNVYLLKDERNILKILYSLYGKHLFPKEDYIDQRQSSICFTVSTYTAKGNVLR